MIQIDSSHSPQEHDLFPSPALAAVISLSFLLTGGSTARDFQTGVGITEVVRDGSLPGCVTLSIKTRVRLAIRIQAPPAVNSFNNCLIIDLSFFELIVI